MDIAVAPVAVIVQLVMLLFDDESRLNPVPVSVPIAVVFVIIFPSEYALMYIAASFVAEALLEAIVVPAVADNFIARI